MNVTLAPPLLNVVSLFLFPGWLLEFSRSWTKRRWCMRPSGNWIPSSETLTALCSICMDSSSQGSLLPHNIAYNCLTNQGMKIFIQETVCCQGGSHTKAENLTWLVLVFFIIFNQAVLLQTTIARAGSEFLLIVIFTLKNGHLIHEFKKNRIWLHQRMVGDYNV